MSTQPAYAQQPSLQSDHYGQEEQPHQWSVVTEEPASRPEIAQRGQEVCRMSKQLYDQNPDWVAYFREVLGLHGYVRKAFQNRDELDQFEQTEEYAELQQMLAKLREQSNAKNPTGSFEPTRVITVRLPKSMHEYLRTEAHDLRTSMNKLCISKLLQVIEQDLIPAERGGGGSSSSSSDRKPITAGTTVGAQQNPNSIPIGQPQPSYQTNY